jgi:hypothetical protein
LWHPAVPGCQDFTGPNPSVFLDSGVKLTGFFDFLPTCRRKTNFFSTFDPVEGFDCLQPQKKMLNTDQHLTWQAASFTLELIYNNPNKKGRDVLFLHI